MPMNYTLLAVYAMKLALGDDQAYLEYPRRALPIESACAIRC